MASSRERAYLDRKDVIFLVLTALYQGEDYMLGVSRTIKIKWGVGLLPSRTLSRLGRVLHLQGWVKFRVERVGRARRMVYSLTDSGEKEMQRRAGIYRGLLATLDAT